MAKQPKNPADKQELRGKLGKEARLWGLSFVCAVIGALTVWGTNNLMAGIGAFLISLIILGGALYFYEKNRGESGR